MCPSRVVRVDCDQNRQEIRAKVQKELDITVSAGVSVNKFIAKVASTGKSPTD